MNKLSEILESYTDNKSLFNSIKYTTTNLQDGSEDTVVFYRLRMDKQSQSSFEKRLSESKADVVITTSPALFSTDRNVISVGEENFEKIQKRICDSLFGKEITTKVIGVTGTNGKSSICHLVSEILNANGFKSCFIGTLGIYSGDKEILPSVGATTPSYVDLRCLLYKLREYDYACLEVSSHALIQKRLGDIELSAIGWSNITQDHLDYHKTEAEYFKAKALIINSSKTKLLVAKEESLISKLESANIEFEEVSELGRSVSSDAFNLRYNKKNLELAYALVKRVLGKEALIPKDLKLPKGRFNTFRIGKSVFVVDYAHTPDAIENVMKETKKAFNNYNVKCVFGCGGDRDRTKRPLMLEAAIAYSHEVIVTTDNPRTEAPADIIEDIIKNIDLRNMVTVIEERREAIEHVVQNYDEETIVVIAGKGHEEYQDINGRKHFFSDIVEVKKCIEKLK